VAAGAVADDDEVERLGRVVELQVRPGVALLDRHEKLRLERLLAAGEGDGPREQTDRERGEEEALHETGPVGTEGERAKPPLN
jgi:hypothetical protein